MYQVQDTSVIDGLVVKSYQYDDFGNIINETGTFEHSFTYTGREWEPELGLYYYRARWYDSAIGRFISEDPIGFAGDGPNLYSYVLNNPVNRQKKIRRKKIRRRKKTGESGKSMGFDKNIRIEITLRYFFKRKGV